MSKLTVAMSLLVGVTLLVALVSVGIAINNAMEAAGAKCERSTLSYKCELTW